MATLVLMLWLAFFGRSLTVHQWDILINSVFLPMLVLIAIAGAGLWRWAWRRAVAETNGVRR